MEDYIQLVDVQPTPEVQQQQPDVVSQPDPVCDPNDADFQAFNTQLTQYIGVDASSLKQYVSHIQQQVLEQTLEPLRIDWGTDYEQNYNAVKERFKQLPAHQQAIYDNVDGARFLHEQLRREAQQQQASVPTFDRGKTGGGAAPTGRYTYTQSQIIAMSKTDYRANIAAIQAAYAQGKVDLEN